MVANTFKRRILSIDGGGIRGIIPAMILNYIEEKTRNRIETMFHMISGTSTGGIIALGLTKRNSDSSSNYEAEYTAAELIDFYRKYGKKIFSEYIPTPIDDLLQPKFSPIGKQEILTNLLGEARIENALREVFITSYDIELRTPVFFTSNYDAEETEGLDSRKICRGFTMVNAAMATSAAPTFFPPYKLKTVHRTSEDYYALVDGGIFANNPTSLALMETMISYKRKTGQELQRDDTLVVSLGTGSLTRKYKYQEAKNWGQLKWALPLLNIVFDGQSESVAYQFNQLMTTKGDRRNYYRFQVPLSADDGHDHMDNASPANIEYLEGLGKILIEQRRESLNQLCEVLCQPL
ncbi:patatin-like phospholipase family protein [Allocoleopsis franciscana]|uniref:Patatin n=1 Tax=Allocoleopsis franciscana PCC 7113 TaxID=1173027 RepID=K9W9D3_9CYAN|nr:patatin-like phospholipase family protein [Allocoleopsis franciscana]AFZ16426.1 patatin [Allocoleopsis franciscana PCC 7113]